ncbi:MAG: M56 family metallopeptidase, partial [Pirellulales bacterium]|nr:M56 family metallopeptidase [Pirellulales bacterium]
MDQIYFGATWCVWQVTLMALICLALLPLLRRRHLHASMLTSVSMGMMLVMTCLSPLPMPSWRLPAINSGRSQEALALSPGPARTSEDSLTSSTVSSSSPAGLSWDTAAVFRRLAEAGKQTWHTDNRSSGGVPWLSLLLPVLCIVGLVQLTLALLGARALVAECQSVDDGRLRRMTTSLARSLGMTERVALMESARIGGPAVLGWKRPVMVLPTDWRTWSDEELRSVLAHELAHISRHDFAWRLLGTVVLTVHYFNPVVHLLMRRLVYSQELAADTAASELIGHRVYLRSLASLALRQGDSFQSRARPSLLPVFTGYLIRRIKMLRSVGTPLESRLTVTTKALTSSAIVLFGFAMMATKGLGQVPADEGAEARIASRPPRIPA